MGFFGKNLKMLRERNGLRQQDLSELIDVSIPMISKWENGKTEALRRDNIDALCAVLNCTEQDLFGYGDGFFSSATGLSPLRTAPVPLVGHVHAGEPEEPTEAEDTVLVPDWLVERDPQCYALIADGDCMDKVYPEGCTIVVSPNTEPRNGCVAVVSIDGREAVMRRMYRTPSTLVLSPESHNPEHKDIVITDSDIWIDYLGTVVWMQGEV